MRSVAKQAFMTVPMSCDLAVWHLFKEAKSRIHFISHGLLLNPLESPDLPPGLEVVALLPRGGNYVDASGWTVTEKVPLVPLLEKVRLLLDRVRAARIS